MSTNLIIIGAGEFGREVHTWATQAVAHGTPWILKGFLDDRPDALVGYDCGIPVLGTIDGYVPSPDDEFLCAVGEPRMKRACYNHMMAVGARFATLIHPSAIVGRNVMIGPGSLVCPFTQLSCDITLGKLVTFGTNSNTAHDTIIGDFAQISGSCEINGRAIVEEGAFLGSHATILPRVRVGAYAYVGAGSVVLKNVKAGVKVFGNPAVRIGLTDDGRV